MKYKFPVLLFLIFLLTGCALSPVTTTSPSTQLPVTEVPGFFEVHYLDVGQADATLIICDGAFLLLDGGNPSDSSLLYAYLKNLGAKHLSYVICSHVHSDHVGGLAGALNYASAETVLCPADDFDSEEFRNFKKYLTCPITIPSPGDTFFLGSAECTILAVNTQPDHPNNSSIVLKVQYGATAFLFSGDAEAAAEAIILDSGADLSCTVLKVPHHGSYTSLTDEWLAAAGPRYAVISCGEHNAYDHPAPVILEKLKKNNIQLFRTDIQGHILCRSDGETVTFEVQKNPNTDPYAPPEATISPETFSPPKNYVLNHNTGVFHHPDCSSASKILEKNREEVNASREELIDRGFSPCGNCHP